CRMAIHSAFGGSRMAGPAGIERLPMTGEHSSGALGRGRVRYVMVFMLFAATTVNYADRASLSIVGPAMQSQLHIDSITLGYIFSAFGWTYVLAQMPGGWLLDRFG